MNFRPVIPPSKTRQGFNNGPGGLFSKTSLLRQNMSVETWLLVGACVQSILFLLLPFRYAALPSGFLLLARVIDTFLVTAGITKNPYMKGAITHAVSSQIPDRDGQLHKAGQEKIAVLLLGFKVNHNLGLFAHGAKDLGKYAGKMYKELEADDSQHGFLGYTTWTRPDENGAIEVVGISYWRSMDDVWRYSQGPLHRKAMQWWAENELKHIGIMHEVFEAPAGLWEGVYLNFQPTLMGKTTFLRRGKTLEGGEVAPEWISPLVDASRGPLRSHKGRLGNVGEKAAQGVYAGKEL